MSLYKKKKKSIEQNSSLHNQIHDNEIHDIINPKYLIKEREKNLKIPKKWHKYESIKTLSPAIHLEEWDRHFEHEYIIRLSKKDFVPYQLNLMLNSDQGLALFR